MKSIIKTILFTVMISGSMFSQNFDQLDIPVYDQGRKLTLANAGGLKAPQFSNIDLNGDGILDLFVFDRNGDKILPFVKTGALGTLDYRFAPEYITQFPKLSLFALLVDYNNDGVKDIFTGSPSLPAGVEVWKGKKDVQGKTSYTLLNFTNATYRNVLHFSNNGSSFANIYVSLIDLPAITDVDGDGDVDVVSFEPDGSFASFYRNLSVEESLDFDQFKFERPTICWGGFAENQFNENITLSDNAFNCAQGFAPGNSGSRHSGSTLTIFDTNGDGLQDIIIGDLGSSKLKKLVNRGTKSTAWIRELEVNFPVDDITVDLDYFVACYFVDVDADGKRDLIVAPNEINNAENNDHIWFYKNEGTDISPIFKLIKKNFLVDEMAYFFAGTHPTFADVDADGLLDLVVGTSGIQMKNGDKENRIFFMKNIGTATNPEFDIINKDFLSFSEVSFETSGRFAPTFGDLDGDGAADLLIGDAVGRLFFFKNESPKGSPYKFGNPIYPFFNISVGQNSKPIIVDVDADGLLDLVIGEKNNELSFLKNIGQKNAPAFNINVNAPPNQRQFGNIFSGNDFARQNGSPAIIQVLGGGKKLIMGSQNENFRVYDMKTDSFPLSLEFMGNINEGSRVVPALADIDQDGYFELAVGNERGGLAFYNTIFKVDGTSATLDDASSNLDIEIYPNPAKNEIFIFSNNEDLDIKLYDIQGRDMMQLQNNTANVLSNDLTSGLYLIKIKHASGTITKKLLIQR